MRMREVSAMMAFTIWAVYSRGEAREEERAQGTAKKYERYYESENDIERQVWVKVVI